jgi:acyl carrier protein
MPSTLPEPPGEFSRGDDGAVVMIELARRLTLLLRAHAPAATSSVLAGDAFGAKLELQADLGFDLVALAELAIAIEDAFGIAIQLADLDGCRTVGDLEALVAARVG